jgi:hypothetical protein
MASGSARKDIAVSPVLAGSEASEFFACLQGADVTSLWTALALGDFKLNPLVFLQIPVTRSHNRREVHEQVRTASVRGDKPEAFFTVEPLHRALCHPVCLLIMMRSTLSSEGSAGPRVWTLTLADRDISVSQGSCAWLSRFTKGFTRSRQDCHRPHRAISNHKPRLGRAITEVHQQTSRPLGNPAAGLAVTPSRWIRRVACPTTNSTCNRCSSSVSTQKVGGENAAGLSAQGIAAS